MWAAALPAWNFFKGNWTWLVPTVIALFLGARVYILDAALARCELDAAKGVAEAYRVTNELREQDRERNEAQLNTLRAEKGLLQKDYDDAQVALQKTPASTGCIGSPAGRAFTDGLRRTPQAGPR